MIEFQHVVRTFGSKTAVDGLDLKIDQGELFAFLGPNGAGKTTSIKMLVGLLRPSAGHVLVCGYDMVSFSRDANRLLGYVPDEPYLYDKLTGREFLEFILDIYGIGRRTGRDHIDREVARFQLADFVDDLTETYSHGMKQRLVFASALLHDPRVLVLDEPMVGLDPKSARLVKDLLTELTRGGTTVFMSTHTLALAEEISHRIGIIDLGRLQFLGTLDQLQQERGETGGTLEQLFLDMTSAEGTSRPAQAESNNSAQPGPPASRAISGQSKRYG